LRLALDIASDGGVRGGEKAPTWNNAPARKEH